MRVTHRVTERRIPPIAQLTIRILGRPQIERGSAVEPAPRGRKAWAVLAFVALAEVPPSRERVAEMLFADASDPLGALRWTLAELRRALQLPDLLKGDPLRLELPADVRLDVLELAGDDPDPELVRGELLEGADPAGDTAFGSWLSVERRRVAGDAEGVLHDAALSALARGDARDAAAFARRALALDEFDESLHELFVRALRATGDVAGARAQAQACDELFRRELGRPADACVARAAEEGAAEPPALGDRAAALGQLRAGRAALDAGAIEPGIACLRQASAEARALGDPAVLAAVLTGLGSALIHAVRGRDEEAAAVLHEAVLLAEEAGDRATECEALRELGYIDAHAGRGAASSRWLARATALAQTDAERSAVLCVRGLALSDRAHYPAAIELLRRSAAAAEECGDDRALGWTLALLGRALLLCDQLDEAADVLDRSLRLVDEQGMVATRPFPEAMRAEVFLHQGDADAAAALVDRAFSLGCRLGDPCWEAFAARATGVIHAATGDAAAALAWKRDAAARASRVTDRYAWAHAFCLDTLAETLIAEDERDEAAVVVDRLEHLAARGDMRELVVRGQLHRAQLGQRGSEESARLLAEGIENPRLELTLTS